MYDKIFPFVGSMISTAQFGFLKTLGNCIKCFSAHTELLHKLKSIGISGKLLKWFHTYLSNRQQLSINGSQSSVVPVSSGVPQGSMHTWSSSVSSSYQ